VFSSLLSLPFSILFQFPPCLPHIHITMSITGQSTYKKQQWHSSPIANSSWSETVHLEELGGEPQEGQYVRRRRYSTRSQRPAKVLLTLQRVPVRLPRWMPLLRVFQCASAAIVLGAGVTSLTIGTRIWVSWSHHHLQEIFLLRCIYCRRFSG
jgi:hypothetical protein